MKLPHSLEPYFDDQARVAHESMAATSLEKHLKEMPRSQLKEVGVQQIRYAEIIPAGDYDNSEAILLELPFANGWAPHMYLRARYLQAVAAPDQRVIVFPQSTISETAYDFTGFQLDQIKQGDVTPIAERQARLVRTLGIGRASIIGYSGGGMNAAVLSEVLADEVSVLSVGVFEPPNVVDRTAKQLTKDFKASGFSYLQAAKDAEIPALVEALGKSPVSWKVLKGTTNFGVSTLLRGNKELKEGMAHNNLSHTLALALLHQPGLGVTLANAEHSKVSPKIKMSAQANTLSPFGNVNHITVEGYDHGMGDNIVVHGLLGKAAVENSKK
ncbi:MAG: hypothetical protein JWO96_567 [Candidatus Saccharibacteria bacterium]|nr:hypothetical protein [Candidatus Saccharibacteria bacterium]